jgi:hypothetical protein
LIDGKWRALWSFGVGSSEDKGSEMAVRGMAGGEKSDTDRGGVISRERRDVRKR